MTHSRILTQFTRSRDSAREKPRSPVPNWVKRCVLAHSLRPQAMKALGSVLTHTHKLTLTAPSQRVHAHCVHARHIPPPPRRSPARAGRCPMRLLSSRYGAGRSASGFVLDSRFLPGKVWLPHAPNRGRVWSWPPLAGQKEVGGVWSWAAARTCNPLDVVCCAAGVADAAKSLSPASALPRATHEHRQRPS